LPPQSARPVHAGRIGADHGHAVGPVPADTDAPLARHAAACAHYGDRRVLPRTQGQQARRSEVPEEHRKRLAAGLLRREPGLAAAPDASATPTGQARRHRRLTLVRTLVLGGIRSGKSLWAESEIATLVAPGEPVCYVATGPKTDADPSWSARIAAHRMRR